MLELDKEELHALVFGFLYPVALGWVLQVYLLNDVNRFVADLMDSEVVVHPRLYFGLVFLFHWTFVFLLYRSMEPAQLHESGYVTYTVGLIFMVLSFSSLPFTSTPETNYVPFYLSVAGIGATYFWYGVYRALHRENNRPTDDPLRKFDLTNFVEMLLMFWGLLFAVLHLAWEPVAGNALLANVFVTGTLLSSVLVLRTFGYVG